MVRHGCGGGGLNLSPPKIKTKPTPPTPSPKSHPHINHTSPHCIPPAPLGPSGAPRLPPLLRAPPPRLTALDAPLTAGPGVTLLLLQRQQRLFLRGDGVQGVGGDNEGKLGGSGRAQADTFLRSLAKRFCRTSSSSVSPGGSVNMAGNGGSRGVALRRCGGSWRSGGVRSP